MDPIVASRIQSQTILPVPIAAAAAAVALVAVITVVVNLRTVLKA